MDHEDDASWDSPNSTWPLSRELNGDGVDGEVDVVA
jgi:hypothetical protein